MKTFGIVAGATAVAVCLATVGGVSNARAGTIDIPLNLSNENVTFQYEGTLSSGDAVVGITIGNCAVNGGNTVCDLTGTFAHGTYDLQTTYAGTTNPVFGVETGPDTSFYDYDFGGASFTATLDYTHGGSVTYDSFGFNQFFDGLSCSFSPCSAAFDPAPVGGTAYAPVTGNLFLSTVPEPLTLSIFGAALVGAGAATRRRRKANKAA